MHCILGGLTEWLRSLIGNQVRCNSPVGSSPMSSAIETEVRNHFRFFVFVEISIGTGCEALPSL